MNETRRFRAGQWCGCIATFTRGRAITEIQVTDWNGDNPRIIGVCKNNKCTYALDCIRILNKLLNTHFSWEVM